MPSRNRPQTPRANRPAKAGRASGQRTEPVNSPAESERGLPQIVQEHPEDARLGWAQIQEQLRAASGLSVLLGDGKQPPALVASNNNSICHAFQSSLEYVSLCDPYCGDAHRRALSAGSAVQYKCHAGMQCFTMPVQIGNEQNLAAIGGRAFVSGADYRSLVDRFCCGELNDLLGSKPFENVIFAEAERLDQLSDRLQKAVRNFNAPFAKTPAEVSKVDEVVDKAQGARVTRPLPNLQDEVDRLRGELEHRTQLAESLQRFLERISTRDPAKTYEAILAHSRELLKADRASLWVFDENTNEITLRAAVGFVNSDFEVQPARMGEGISGRVLESGKALVVGNLETAGLTPAPADRQDRT